MNIAPYCAVLTSLALTLAIAACGAHPPQPVAARDAAPGVRELPSLKRSDDGGTRLAEPDDAGTIRDSESYAGSLAGARARIRRCYERALATSDAPFSGNVVLRIVIGADGKVESASDERSTIPDASVVQCVIAVVRGVSFAPPADGALTILYPVHFVTE